MMNRALQILAITAAATVMAALVLACDPIGPGAIGEATLGDEVSTDGFVSLEVRIFPTKGKAWTIKDGVPADRSLHVHRYPLSSVRFPFTYEVSSGVGVSDDQEWRALLFLSKTPVVDGLPQPVSGDVYGTGTFELLACTGFSGFCNVTSGVDVRLDAVVP